MEVIRHEADDVSWAFARCLPHPALREDVLGYTGYAEHAWTPMRRREVPSPRVPVIISFGDTIRVVGGAAEPATGRPLTSFVAGFSDGYSVTEYVGGQRGLQVDFTPIGAYRLLGLSGAELSGGVLELADVLGVARTRVLTDRLVSAADWSSRFELVDAVLVELRERSRPADPGVHWTWQQLVRTGGRLPVSRLAAEVGWSRRHFIQRFHRHTGLGPKAAARVIRFDRAARLLGTGMLISDVAAAAGFADHSHLVRESRSMAGCTPSVLLSEWGADDIRPGQLEVT